MPPLPPRTMSRRTWLRSAAATALAGSAGLGACGVSALSRARSAGLDAAGPARLDATAARRPLALVGGRMFDGERFAAGTIVVVGEEIVAAGSDAVVPSGARQVDCTGITLIPGVIDSHVHLQFSSPAAVLGGGVTTVRDLGGPPDAALALRGATPLRVLSAARILTPVGGYPSRSWGADGSAREVRGAYDAPAAVAEQLSAGADLIKVALEPAGGAPMFDGPTLHAIVTAAHADDARVTVHVASQAGLALALDAGVDELAHLPLHDVSPRDMVRCAEAGMALVPTLAIRDAGSQADVSARRALTAFREAGGLVVYGSDLGNAGTAPGVAVGEIRALLASGMTAAEVLRAATSDAAAYLGLDRVGHLAAGWTADVLGVYGLPDVEPAAYGDVRLVLAGGAPVVDRLGIGAVEPR